MPRLARIFVFPVKSLSGVERSETQLVRGSGLRGDRQFAIFDADGQVVNGKRFPQIHRLISQFDLDTWTVTLRRAAEECLPPPTLPAPPLLRCAGGGEGTMESDPLRSVTGLGDAETFSLEGPHQRIEQWLSDYFRFAVQLRENRETGYPDDLQAPGPTVIGTATLRAVADWFPGLTVEECRRRFRTNLEIETTEPFWEDGLFGASDDPVRFRIGDVQMLGINPCQRCAVPTRWSNSGQAMPGFSKTFARLREETMPAWSPRVRFNHFYRLAVNTRVPDTEAGKWLRLNDEVQIQTAHEGTA